MINIGDVFTVVASIFAIGFSAWALLMGMAFLFGRRAVHAERAVETRPWKSLWVGLAVTLLAGTLGIVMLSLPSPIVKLLGWMVLLALFAVSALGATGIALVASRRIESLEPGLSHYGALARAAMILVVACWVPILGWFAFVPLVLAIGTGAGLSALLHRETAPATPPTDPSTVRFMP